MLVMFGFGMVEFLGVVGVIGKIGLTVGSSVRTLTGEVLLLGVASLDTCLRALPLCLVSRGECLGFVRSFS